MSLPLIVPVTSGLVTVTLRVPASVTTPPSVRLFVATVPPNAKSRFTVTGLFATMALVPERIANVAVGATVKSPITKVPPEPKAEALPRINDPSVSLMPVVNVLVALSTNDPEPVLLICPKVPELMTAVMTRPIGERPAP